MEPNTFTFPADEIPGGAIDAPDIRDHQADQILGASVGALPERVMLDLREGNQGADIRTKVACTCFSAYHVAQIANEIEHQTPHDPDFFQGWELQGKFGTRSAQGDFVQTALKSVVKNGLITKSGVVRSIKGYAEVKKPDLKARLAERFAIVTSVRVTNTNFKNAKKDGKWTGNDGAIVGGHAICLVGYEPGFYIASNSYGPDWGFFKNGTFKIAENLIGDLGTCYLIYDEDDINEADFIFKDVTVKSPMAKEIQHCKDLGLVKGFEDGRFRPDEPLTRAQACVLMSRLVDYVESKYNK